MTMVMGLTMALGASGGGADLLAQVQALFGGGALGVIYDTGVLSSLFQDRSATPTTPAVVDGIVGTRKDLSGNGLHQIAPSDAARPILRAAEGRYWLEYDMIDDSLRGGDVSAIGTNAAVFGGMAASDAGGSVFLQGTPALSGYVGVLQSGSGSQPQAPLGTTTYAVDGVSVASTRAALFTSIASASGVAPHLLECRNVNCSTNPYSQITTGHVAGFVNFRRDYGLLVISEARLGVNAPLVRTWLGQRMGLPL